MHTSEDREGLAEIRRKSVDTDLVYTLLHPVLQVCQKVLL